MGVNGNENQPKSLRVERNEFEISETDRASYIHVSSERAIGPKVIFAPGLGETAEGTFQKPAIALANRGHDVFAITNPDTAPDDEFFIKEKNVAMHEWISKFGSKIPPNEIKKLFKNIPITEFRKAYGLIRFIEMKVQGNTIDPVDVIAHSQGGAYALIAAFLRPDLFRKLILVNPAGQSREGFFRMVRRFHTTMFTDAVRSGKWGHVGHTLYALAAHWGMGYIRAIRQGWSLSKFNAYPYLKVLSTIAPDLERVTMYDSADRIFRKQRIEEAARIARKGIPEEQAFGERKSTENFGHYGPVTNPEEYADMFHNSLTKKSTL